MKRILIIFIIAITIITIMMPIISFAENIDTGIYENIYEKPSGTNKFQIKAGQVLGIIQVIAISIAVIMVTVVGIKYMTSSVQEKAAAKEQLIMVAIGAILLFGGASIMSIIANWANEF